MDVALIEILRCPESGQGVAIASTELVQRLESLRLNGTLLDVSNAPLKEAIRGGLVRQDGTRFFPIREGIPVMLREESIEIPQ